MASSTTSDCADVPLHGGYTRFELELEVRTAAVLRHGPLSRFCFISLLTLP
jgi:hypothetical protein